MATGFCDKRALFTAVSATRRASSCAQSAWSAAAQPEPVPSVVRTVRE